MILGESDPNSEFEYGIFGTSNNLPQPLHQVLHEECTVEEVELTWTNCGVVFEEACSKKEKVVGDKITYENECKEKEVEVCKPVHYVAR